MKVVIVEEVLVGTHLLDKAASRVAGGRLKQLMHLVESTSTNLLHLNIPFPSLTLFLPTNRPQATTHSSPLLSRTVSCANVSSSCNFKSRDLGIRSTADAVSSFQLMSKAPHTMLSVEDRRVYVVAPQPSSTLWRMANCICMSSSCDFKSAISSSRLRSALFAPSNSRSRRSTRS